MDVFIIGLVFFVAQDLDLNASPSPPVDWRLDAVARSVLLRWREKVGLLESEVVFRRQTGKKARLPGFI